MQELGKLQYRVNLWTCGTCGKSFYKESYLDMHIAKQHSDLVTTVRHNLLISIADFKDLLLKHRMKVPCVTPTTVTFSDAMGSTTTCGSCWRPQTQPNRGRRHPMPQSLTFSPSSTNRPHISSPNWDWSWTKTESSLTQTKTGQRNKVYS